VGREREKMINIKDKMIGKENKDKNSVL